MAAATLSSTVTVSSGNVNPAVAPGRGPKDGVSLPLAVPSALRSTGEGLLFLLATLLAPVALLVVLGLAGVKSFLNWMRTELGVFV